MPRYSSTRDLEDGVDVRPQFSRDGAVVDIPRRRMAEESVDPETAYHVIKDELMLDGHARLNVATFGTTWMEPQAERLMADAGIVRNRVTIPPVMSIATVIAVDCATAVAVMTSIVGATYARYAARASTPGATSAPTPAPKAPPKT